MDCSQRRPPSVPCTWNLASSTRSGVSRRGNAGGEGSGAPRPRFAPWLVIPILLVALLVFNNVLSNTQRESIAYSEFLTAVEEGRIDPETTVEISDSGITGALTTEGVFHGVEHRMAVGLQLSPQLLARDRVARDQQDRK